MFFLMLLCGVSLQSQAAIITWSMPTDASGDDTDILTIGSLHDSATAFNSDVIVNGQLFNRDLGLSGGTVTFNNSAITIGNVGSNDNYGNLPAIGWDSEYLKLVDQGVWLGNGGGVTINIGNLVIGNDYLIQLWNPYWNINWTTEYKDELGNSSALLNHGLLASNIAPQYVVGMFTANSSVQTITAFGPSYAIVGSLQVRNTTISEPGALALLGLSLLGLGFARRKKA